MLHNPQQEISLTARMILLNAAEYLERHAWCQGALRYKGAVCMFGAVAEVRRDFCVVSGKEQDMTVDAEVCRRLRKVTKCEGVAGWNDAKGRTKQQVINALKRAAR